MFNMNTTRKTRTNTRITKKTKDQTRFIKQYCRKKPFTNRCVKSSHYDETTPLCRISKRTQRCKNIKFNVSYITYKGYKVKRNVFHFLNKNVINVPLANLILMAERDPDYEYGLKYIFGDTGKSSAEIKDQLIGEILELAQNAQRQQNDSNIITMKSVREVIQRNRGLRYIF